MLHHRLVGRGHKNATLYLHLLSWDFVVVFYHFHLFFDEVSNIGNMILTTHKLELVIRNCKWKYVHIL